jgi:hypothetical protein
MLFKSHLLLVGLIACGSAFAAGLPVKQPVTKYLHLSQDSPFTNDSVGIPGPPPESAFKDWALGGVSEVEGGYMVTLVNKKNQGETQVIKPRGTVHSTKDEMKWIDPGAHGSFKVEGVEFGKKSWKDTIVLVSVGGEKGTMKFDDNQLAPASAAVPAGGARPPGQPTLPNPAIAQPSQQPPTVQSNGRAPRPRVPLPAPNTQSRPTR